MLWIAFVLCTFGLIYSSYYNQLTLLTVVNCFRSLYLWVDLQHPRRFYVEVSGCELLSFFVPLGWFTAAFSREQYICELWIAFVLCTFGLIYSISHGISPRPWVVNCFRSLYLWVDLQHARWRQSSKGSCELLSFFVPLGWFTASSPSFPCRPELWIAFVLCTFGLIYSRRVGRALHRQLWIAFVLCTFGLIYSHYIIK